MHADFVHLHNHSDYSLLDGASPIPRMLERAAALKMPALALTDHGSLFAPVKFYQEGLKPGVKPLFAMQASFPRAKGQNATPRTATHLCLLPANDAAYATL